MLERAVAQRGSSSRTALRGVLLLYRTVGRARGSCGVGQLRASETERLEKRSELKGEALALRAQLAEVANPIDSPEYVLKSLGHQEHQAPEASAARTRQVLAGGPKQRLMPVEWLAWVFTDRRAASPADCSDGSIPRGSGTWNKSAVPRGQ